MTNNNDATSYVQFGSFDPVSVAFKLLSLCPEVSHYDRRDTKDNIPLGMVQFGSFEPVGTCTIMAVEPLPTSESDEYEERMIRGKMLFHISRVTIDVANSITIHH